ncbi:MAG: cupin domain-containing protein [Pseudomonadota bacterium]|nr:cupin domain-containing protein [Pseudomonadota bacterium]
MKADRTGGIRLVVTGHDTAGKSTFVRTDALECKAAVHLPGFATAMAWATGANLKVPDTDDAFRARLRSQHPDPGESRLLVVTFAPDSVAMSPDFDPQAAAAEMAQLAPGMAERFEVDHPGMHRTDSVDYGFVLSGEIWLELDEGRTEHLQLGDVVVQNGTRHAWRNRSDRPATMVFVMLGARRD